MAIAAMEQFGWYISSLGLPATDRLEIPRVTSVRFRISPFVRVTPFPTWASVGYDRGWVAARLGLDLLLIKSVDGIRIRGEVQERFPPRWIRRMWIPALFPSSFLTE